MRVQLLIEKDLGVLVLNKTKPKKKGIKMYINASSANGYVYQIKLYTGKGSTVLEVIENLTYKYRRHNQLSYTDNFNTSLKIIMNLRSDKIFMSGICRTNKKNLPKTLIIQSTKLLKKSSYWHLITKT
ncbi:PiggyBac transposable element-derived protein 4 [Cucumispora dikerogammari]|nr:PiggyBac transposable element-derived protein 4 [Cucumispora dikerogammari]